MSTETPSLVETDTNRSADPHVPESLRRVVCLSVSHDATSTDRIAAVAPDDPVSLAEDVKSRDRITECATLVTCNRVELYASTRTADDDDLATVLSVAYEALGAPCDAQEYLGLDAVEHLFRVACGLESAALGEDQILGQVSESFEEARQAGLVGGALSRVVPAAVRVGQNCREETSIGEGEMGYGGAICRSIVDSLGSPPSTLLIVGAGEMAELAAQAAATRWETRVDVANRTPAESLTTADGTYWPLDQLGEALTSADAVVTATAAQNPILGAEHVEHCEPRTPVVDLANPPDVAAEVRNRGTLVVTGLEEVTAQLRAATQSRRETVPAVEDRIDAAIDRLVDSERENSAEETLRELHRTAAEIREQELKRARNRLQDGEADQEDVLSEFASALTGQLLAEPTEALRDAARGGETETIAAAERLFDLDGGEQE